MIKKQESKKLLKGKNVVLGICGSIAAYKSLDLIRALRKLGANVICILTKAGREFVTPLSLSVLSKNKVYESMFEKYDYDIEHISISEKADIFVVAPASCDAIARFAQGRAEDLLSSVALATRAPVLICPAMNSNMWEHPLTVNNIKILKECGYHFEGPVAGELACGNSGSGRFTENDRIILKIKKILIND